MRVREIMAWVENAKPGDVIEYVTGERNLGGSAAKRTVWDLYEEGILCGLRQRREADGTLTYLATRAAP